MNTETATDRRIAKGHDLLAASAVTVTDYGFTVRGSDVDYTVSVEQYGLVTRYTCSCPDFERWGRRPRFQCKHVVAVALIAGPAEPEDLAALALPSDDEIERALETEGYDSAVWTPEPGAECVARLRGQDVPVRLGPCDPRTYRGRGFRATDLRTGRLITVPSPGNLRPAA